MTTYVQPELFDSAEQVAVVRTPEPGRPIDPNNPNPDPNAPAPDDDDEE